MDMAIRLHDGLHGPPDGRSAMPSLKILADLEYAPRFQAFFAALVFSRFDGESQTAHLPLTHTVGRLATIIIISLLEDFFTNKKGE
jgi:hypothetical protein